VKANRDPGDQPDDIVGPMGVAAMNLRTATLVLVLAVITLGTAWARGQAPPPAEKPVAEPVKRAEVAEGGPRLELSAEEWDFGSKWSGEPCSTEITIKNVGDAPLKILRIKSSCGCTALEPSRTELAPGESDKMTLTYNTKKDKENVSQTIRLETNDPERPRVTIHVTGTVKKVYDAKPANRITFAKIERDSLATQSIELRNNMEEEVVLKLKPFDEPPPFEIKLEEIEPGRVYKLSATTKPPLQLGANSVNIVLETGLKEFPSLTIPASVYIAPRVYVQPPSLRVSPQVTSSFQRIVKVFYQADEPVEIKAVKSSHPDLIKVELLPPRKPVKSKASTPFHEIRVTLPPGAELPEGGGRIEIYTDHPSPEYQKLVVQVQLQKSMPRAVEHAEGEPAPARPALKPKEQPAKPDD
jgi:hypothetical protein